MGILEGLFGGGFDDFYSNPDVVLIAFLFLFIILFYVALNKFNFLKSKGINIILSVVAAVIIVYNLRGVVDILRAFNLAIVLFVLGIFLIIFWSFVKAGAGSSRYG